MALAEKPLLLEARLGTPAYFFTGEPGAVPPEQVSEIETTVGNLLDAVPESKKVAFFLTDGSGLKPMLDKITLNHPKGGQLDIVEEKLPDDYGALREEADDLFAHAKRSIIGLRVGLLNQILSGGIAVDQTDLAIMTYRRSLEVASTAETARAYNIASGIGNLKLQGDVETVAGFVDMVHSGSLNRILAKKGLTPIVNPPDEATLVKVLSPNRRILHNLVGHAMDRNINPVSSFHAYESELDKTPQRMGRETEFLNSRMKYSIYTYAKALIGSVLLDLPALDQVRINEQVNYLLDEFFPDPVSVHEFFDNIRDNGLEAFYNVFGQIVTGKPEPVTVG